MAVQTIVRVGLRASTKKSSNLHVQRYQGLGFKNLKVTKRKIRFMFGPEMTSYLIEGSLRFESLASAKRFVASSGESGRGLFVEGSR